MFKKNRIFVLLFVYLICAICYALSPYGKPEVIGSMTFVGEAGMDILICILALQLYNKTNGKRRLLFGIIAGLVFGKPKNIRPCNLFVRLSLTGSIMDRSHPT